MSAVVLNAELDRLQQALDDYNAELNKGRNCVRENVEDLAGVLADAAAAVLMARAAVDG